MSKKLLNTFDSEISLGMAFDINPSASLALCAGGTTPAQLMPAVSAVAQA